VTRSHLSGFASFVRAESGGSIPAGGGARDAKHARELPAHPRRCLRAASGAEFVAVHVLGRDRIGMDHIRLQQSHRGVRVTAAEMMVHLRAGSVVAASARALELPEDFDVVPETSPEEAQEAVQTLLRSASASKTPC
jgi:Zn-dependent metalloprotease